MLQSVAYTIEGVKSALVGAKGAVSAGISKLEATDVLQYRNWTVEERDVGLKALGRVYAGWGFSQTFYREKVYESHLGFKDLDDFMTGFWETVSDPGAIRILFQQA